MAWGILSPGMKKIHHDEKKEAHELHELTRIILIFFRVFRVFRGPFSQQRK
jgi:hypothetical protein